MTTTLYLEGNFLPDFWLKPNLFYQKLATSKYPVILISDSVAPDLILWLKEKNPLLNLQYFNPMDAAEFLKVKEHLSKLSAYQLFVEDRDGSIPKEIYTQSLNAGPSKAFVLARWIDWVASSKSTFTSAFSSLSISKSVINNPSELYQFVDLFPESESLVLLWQKAINTVPMGAYYIFNKGNQKLPPFSIYDSNQRRTFTGSSGDSISNLAPSHDLTDLSLTLERMESLIESFKKEYVKEDGKQINKISTELLGLKSLIVRYLKLEFGLEENEVLPEIKSEFKSVEELISKEKNKQTQTNLSDAEQTVTIESTVSKEEVVKGENKLPRASPTKSNPE